MNYIKIYNSLMSRGKLRILTGYQEMHHILPKCLGGSDNIDNLVGLTPEEHFLAHQLLVKIYPDNEKLIYACRSMIIHNSTFRVNNKMYGWLKRKHSVAVSNHFREHWADDNKRKLHIESMKKSNKTAAVKIKRSNAMKKQWENASDERRQQIIQIQKENNFKVAQRNKELWATEEYRNKMKSARSGVFWWTNGVEEKKSRKAPEGFVRGRLKKHKEN